MLSAKVATLAKAGTSSLTATKLHWTAAVLVALVVVGACVGWSVSGKTVNSESHDVRPVDEQPQQTQADNGPVEKKQPIKESPEERCRRLVVPKVLASLKSMAMGNRGDATLKSLRRTPDGKWIELQVNWKHGINDKQNVIDYESNVTFQYHLQTGECKVWVKDVLTGQMRRVQPHRAIVPLRIDSTGWEWAIRLKGLDDAVAAFDVLRELQHAP
jgi:hypothetical protein